MKNFKIGDRIKFIDEIGEAKILDVLDQDQLLIEDSNGFEYQIHKSKVILVDNASEEEKAYKKNQPSYEDILIQNVDSKKLKRANSEFDNKYKSHEEYNTPTGQSYVEVDLHIHELIANESGLNASDKLDIQVAHFERMMKRAEQQKLSRIVFIHGVGQGILRNKIRSLLDAYYPNAEYLDGNYTEYGYGATDVRIKR